MAITVTLDPKYGYVLISVLTWALYVTLVGFLKTGGARKENFHFEIMHQFEKEHKDAFGKDSKPDKQGYPDNGQGRYSKKMSYREWMEFNSAQLAHHNLMSVVFPIGILILVAGIKYPLITSYLAFGFIASRVAQLLGPNKFTSSGGSMVFQILGFWVGSIAMLGLFYYAYHSCQELKPVAAVVEAAAEAVANATAGAGADL